MATKKLTERQEQILSIALQNGGEATLELLQKRFPSASVYEDLVPAMKGLDSFGRGRFILGRRNHKTRFMAFSEAAPEIASSMPEPKVEVPKKSSATNMCSYDFRIRHDVAVTLQLPSDLTKAEAQRLCQFIGALPLE